MTSTQLYRVKLKYNHTASNVQHVDGYLYDPWAQKPHTYTRGEALKKARMFGGKIEATGEKLYESHSFATCSVQDVRNFLSSQREEDTRANFPKLLSMTDDELDKFIERYSTKFVIHNADYGIDYSELERTAESL